MTVKFNKILIVVPVYNIEKYLRNSLESIFKQTHQYFDVLIINDGSTDKTLDICLLYEKKYFNCIIISTSNKGAGASRNRGIEFALNHPCYKYITFIDGDDIISNNYLELMYNSLVKTNTKICIGKTTHNYSKINENVESNYKIIESKDIYINRRGYQNYAPFSPCNKLFDISIFKNNRFPENKFHEDGFIIPQIMLEQRNVSIIDSFTYYYLQREGSATNSPFSYKEFDRIEALEKFVEYCIKNHDNEVIQYAINTLMTFIKDSIKKVCCIKNNVYKKELVQKRKIILKKYYKYWKVSIFDKYRIAYLNKRTLKSYFNFILFILKIKR